MSNLRDQVMLANDRDHRTFDWLCREVGETRIEEAIGQLAGNRKPYLSNLCKLLGVTPPAQLTRTSDLVAREKLAGIKAMLHGK